MKPRALVTGGAGYFGARLVARLATDGQTVRVFDLHAPREAPAGVELVRGDIRDAAAVRSACEGVDTVFHNVATVPLAKDRAAFWSVNRDGTGVLLDAARAAGVRKVVHTSSSAVYGAPPENPVVDATPLRPREAYGRAKLAAEELCERAADRGLDVTIIRPRTILGPGRLGILQILFEWVRQGKNVPVLGGGRNPYQFVHAEDLAEACLLAARRPGPATYNVGAERFGTMRETIEGLVAHAGTGSRLVSLPFTPAVALMKVTSQLGLSPLGDYHALMYGRSMAFDISRAKRELGWAPRHGNVAMISEAYDWYLDHREEVLGARDNGSPHTSPVRQGVLAAVSWVLGRWG